MLVDHGIRHFEEPCPYWELDWTREVTEALAPLDIDVTGGEQDCELATWRRMIDMRAVDVVQPDICYLGGLTRTLRVAAMARAAGLPCTPHAANLSLVTVFTLHMMGAIAGGGSLRRVHHRGPGLLPVAGGSVRAGARGPRRQGPDSGRPGLGGGDSGGLAGGGRARRSAKAVHDGEPLRRRGRNGTPAFPSDGFRGIATASTESSCVIACSGIGGEILAVAPGWSSLGTRASRPQVGRRPTVCSSGRDARAPRGTRHPLRGRPCTPASAGRTGRRHDPTPDWTPRRRGRAFRANHAA